MSRSQGSLAVRVAACMAFIVSTASSAYAADREIKRGEYLVRTIGCTDCHTAGSLIGRPNMKLYLAGSDVGFAVPGLGVFVGPNLTPDKNTGLGNWTKEQIVVALTTGVRPDGRILAPVMPWMDLAHLTKDDATAIAVYLKSLPPQKRATPGPFGPTEKPTVFVMSVTPPDEYVKLAKPETPAGK